MIKKSAKSSMTTKFDWSLKSLIENNPEFWRKKYEKYVIMYGERYIDWLEECVECGGINYTPKNDKEKRSIDERYQILEKCEPQKPSLMKVLESNLDILYPGVGPYWVVSYFADVVYEKNPKMIILSMEKESTSKNEKLISIAKELAGQISRFGQSIDTTKYIDDLCKNFNDNIRLSYVVDM